MAQIIHNILRSGLEERKGVERVFACVVLNVVGQLTNMQIILLSAAARSVWGGRTAVELFIVHPSHTHYANCMPCAVRVCLYICCVGVHRREPRQFDPKNLGILW